MVDAAVSGSVAPQLRPQLAPVLKALDSGDADALVVAGLDRITRSLFSWAELVER